MGRDPHFFNFVPCICQRTRFLEEPSLRNNNSLTSSFRWMRFIFASIAPSFFIIHLMFIAVRSRLRLTADWRNPTCRVRIGATGAACRPTGVAGRAGRVTTSRKCQPCERPLVAGSRPSRSDDFSHPGAPPVPSATYQPSHQTVDSWKSFLPP
jgi:hypothetical protein